MKKFPKIPQTAMKKLCLIAVVALLFGACSPKAGTTPEKKGSSGKTLEVLVVADRNVYCGATKALVDSIFTCPQVGLPQPESRFDIVNIPMSSYENSEMFRNHRNILLMDVKPGNPDKVFLHVDEYAAPQVVVDFAARSNESLNDLLRHYEPQVLEQIYGAEHRRVIKAFAGMPNFQVNDAIRQQFGFDLMFSKEFSMAKQEDGFAWVRKEAKDFGIGVLVDMFAYRDTSIFQETQLLDRLDTVMARHVPSSAPGSYMGLERRRDNDGNYLAPIVSKRVPFEGSDYCVETRGCWRSFGDWMGGPFVSYALLSPDKKNVIILTGYVYCPRNKPWTKRDLLMQVEGICHSLKF